MPNRAARAARGSGRNVRIRGMFRHRCPPANYLYLPLAFAFCAQSETINWQKSRVACSATLPTPLLVVQQQSTRRSLALSLCLCCPFLSGAFFCLYNFFFVFFFLFQPKQQESFATKKMQRLCACSVSDGLMESLESISSVESERETASLIQRERVSETG